MKTNIFVCIWFFLLSSSSKWHIQVFVTVNFNVYQIIFMFEKVCDSIGSPIRGKPITDALTNFLGNTVDLEMFART